MIFSFCTIFDQANSKLSNILHTRKQKTKSLIHFLRQLSMVSTYDNQTDLPAPAPLNLQQKKKKKRKTKFMSIFRLRRKPMINPFQKNLTSI